MIRKVYLKPEAEYITFYSDEELNASMPIGGIDQYADEDDSDIDAGVSGGNTVGPEIDPDWGWN